jgi:acid stress-induced BolA-like protein IbaG/YrbA
VDREEALPLAAVVVEVDQEADQEVVVVAAAAAATRLRRQKIIRAPFTNIRKEYWD